MKNNPKVSIIMPTYNQRTFIRRGIKSVFQQSMTDWELIIIDDGSLDDTYSNINDLVEHEKIKYHRIEKNIGLGAAANVGLKLARGEYIAYLPSDDFYYENHLSSFFDDLSENGFLLAYSKADTLEKDSFGELSDYALSQYGVFLDHGLQLVQVVHRNLNHFWLERKELVTDDYSLMFFSSFIENNHGDVLFIDESTCFWTPHANQRHRKINEKFGGEISKYKQFYGVDHPIRFMKSPSSCMDEIERYQHFRNIKVNKDKGLKILIVGELSYNPERIIAFEEHGHELFGLWSKNIASWTSTGPLGFGNITNIRYDKNWVNEVKTIKPDIIYALFNHHAIPLAHEVLSMDLNIPFVWHFNETPFVSMKNGYWDELIDLYEKSDGKIFINPELMKWYSQFLSFEDDCILIKDGDMAKMDYSTGSFTEKLSSLDNMSHTVVTGRTIGISLEMIEQLASNNIHLHAYSGNGDKFNSQAKHIAPDHYHVHKYCSPQNWRKELSKYDAGWLHCIPSKNFGSIEKCSWDDFNFPCRMSTYAAAGLPIIQLKNEGHIVASNNFIKTKGVDILFSDIDELARKLKNKNFMKTKNQNMYDNMLSFTFDHHIPEFIEFFHRVIDSYNLKKTKSTIYEGN